MKYVFVRVEIMKLNSRQIKKGKSMFYLRKYVVNICKYVFIEKI